MGREDEERDETPRQTVDQTYNHQRPGPKQQREPRALQHPIANPSQGVPLRQ